MATAGPSANHRTPKPTEAAIRLSATTVWAAPSPVASLSGGVSWLASADSTPSVAA